MGSSGRKGEKRSLEKQESRWNKDGTRRARSWQRELKVEQGKHIGIWERKSWKSKVRTIQRRRHSKSQMRKDTHVCAQSLFPKMVKRRENQEKLDWKKDSLKKQLVKPGWCAFFLWIDKTQGMDPQGCQGGRRGNSVTAGETAEDRFPKQNLQIEFPFETPPSTYPYSYFHFFSNGGSPCKDLPA